MTVNQPEGFLAAPQSGKGRGVLVLHAWWGLNQTIRDFCSRLSSEGFMAFAPDLYHGKVAKIIPEAEALGGALDANHQQAEAEIAESARYLDKLTEQPGQGIAVIGFSMGAYYALHLSTTEPQTIRKVVLFYGTGPADFSKSSAEYLGHFAEDDPFEPPANVDELEAELKKAGRSVTFYRYGGVSHWFFEPDVIQAYNPEVANLAWERTQKFLKR